jgi:hypothetical protein
MENELLLRQSWIHRETRIFYKEEVKYARDSIYSKSDQYWSKTVTKVWVKWIGVYKMLDTLQTVKKFKQITSFVTVLASGYINVGNFDYGPIFPVLVIMKWRAFA